MTQRAIEQHLSGLLSDFNRRLYLNYMQKVEYLKSKLQELDFEDKTDLICYPDSVGKTALRISFDVPVHIMLSHPMCRFRSQKRYKISENPFIANLGIVPVYFASINTMTVMRTWGKRTDRLFSPINIPIPEETVACWQLSNRGKETEFSTMNFILQQGSTETPTSENLSAVFEDYLKFTYWSFPRPGFTFSTHILDSKNHITSVIKVAKSIYVIDDVGPKHTLKVEGQMIDCRVGSLRGLVKKGGAYFFSPFKALIEEELADKVLVSEKGRGGFINGMVTEVKQPNSRYEFMVAVQDYGESYSDFIQVLIGIIAISNHLSSSHASFVGKSDNIQNEILKIFQGISQQINLKKSIADAASNSFNSLFDPLFPVLVLDDGDVLYTHPLVISFLVKNGITVDVIKNDKKLLVSILRLLDKCLENRFESLYLSNELEYLSSKGLPKRETLTGVIRTAEFIKILKIVHNCFEIECL